MLKSQHGRPKRQRTPLPQHQVPTRRQAQNRLEVGRDEAQRLVLAETGVLGGPGGLEGEGLDAGVAWGSYYMYVNI